MLELTETYGAQGMMGVPTMLIALMEHPNFAQTDLSTLMAICSGGSLVPEQLVRTLEKELGAPFTIVYGQTECSPVLNMTRPDDTIEDKALTIGAPMPCMEIRIVDPETGETLPVGETGELVTRGYQVMHGYYLMPERTAETIDHDGWLHTGDLAAMDERGYCTIEGRLKDMIIRGGGEHLSERTRGAVVLPRSRGGGGGRRPSRREMGRDCRCICSRCAGSRRGQERTLRLYARQSCPSQNAEAVVCGRRVPVDRFGKDPEVQAARAVGSGGSGPSSSSGRSISVEIVAV